MYSIRHHSMSFLLIMSLPIIMHTFQYFTYLHTYNNYGTNHPQLKQTTCVTHVSHTCCLRVTRVLLSWHGRLFSYTHVWVHMCAHTNSFTHACAYMHTKCLHADAFASVT